jgi:hypothetical protein
MKRILALTLGLVAGQLQPAAAQEPEKKDRVFSGPQVGEHLPAFKVRGVFGDAAGKELDFVEQAKGKPIVLVFVHDLNRLSMSMVRTLTGYTSSRAKDGLATGIVWLSDDVTEAENTLKRIAYAMTKEAPIGISPDGKEGPGAYGLNRSVMLTILVGKDNKVTANFALVQPSLVADLPKILDEVVKVAGGQAPKVDDLLAAQQRNMPNRPGATPQRPEPDPRLREFISPVIRKDAKPEDVEKAAQALEEHAKKHEAFRKEVGRIANTIINNGKLENYGTPKAQEYLRKWAKEYGTPKVDDKKGGR